MSGIAANVADFLSFLELLFAATVAAAAAEGVSRSSLAAVDGDVAFDDCIMWYAAMANTTSTATTAMSSESSICGGV